MARKKTAYTYETLYSHFMTELAKFPEWQQTQVWQWLAGNDAYGKAEDAIGRRLQNSHAAYIKYVHANEAERQALKVKANRPKTKAAEKRRAGWEKVYRMSVKGGGTLNPYQIAKLTKLSPSGVRDIIKRMHAHFQK